MPDHAVAMQDDIVIRVEKLIHTFEKTVHRVEALRIAVVGHIAANARRAPELAAKALRDLILVLDATAEHSNVALYATELRELCDGLDESFTPFSTTKLGMTALSSARF